MSEILNDIYGDFKTSVVLAQAGRPIYLGRTGEAYFNKVRFDIEDYYVDNETPYLFSIMIQREGEVYLGENFVIVGEQGEHHYLEWLVSPNYLNNPGQGKIELFISREVIINKFDSNGEPYDPPQTQSEVQIIKSAIYDFIVLNSLDNTSAAPPEEMQTWFTELVEAATRLNNDYDLIEQVPDRANEAAASANAAAASADIASNAANLAEGYATAIGVMTQGYSEVISVQLNVNNWVYQDNVSDINYGLYVQTITSSNASVNFDTTASYIIRPSLFDWSISADPLGITDGALTYQNEYYMNEFGITARDVVTQDEMVFVATRRPYANVKVDVLSIALVANTENYLYIYDGGHAPESNS